MSHSWKAVINANGAQGQQMRIDMGAVSTDCKRVRTFSVGMVDVREATASRMVVSSASESSLPTSAPVFLAYFPGLLISEGGAPPARSMHGELGCVADSMMDTGSNGTRYDVGSSEEA